MATITEWLASLGMSEYAQRFADNRIDDASILRDLTDQDLKDLGVPLGHRRKMLRAIAEMVGAAPTQMQSAPEPKPRDDAERRQLTVMFTDLVGSTALSTKLPIVDNFERTLEFVRAAAAEEKLDKLEALIVGEYGRPREDVRFIASMLSIPWETRYGALAMTPQRFKDEILRALVNTVRAGLALVEAVGNLHSEDPLQVRDQGQVALPEGRPRRRRAQLHSLARLGPAAAGEVVGAAHCDQLRATHARPESDQGSLRPSSVYGWFTEGFGTKDLKEAKALLDEFAS